MSLKMYVLIREQLSEAQQAVQAGHALAKFGMDHPDEFEEWQNDSNTLIYLSVRDIHHWQTVLVDGGFKHSMFSEPMLHDWNGSSFCSAMDTAIAVAPNWTCQYLLFKDLPLALQPKPEPKKWWQQ